MIFDTKQSNLPMPTSEELDNFRKDTKDHIELVGKFIQMLNDGLQTRAAFHDASKLQSPELEQYSVVIPKLTGTTFGDPKRKEILAQMQPAIDHHYAVNPHHPENHENGFAGMDLFDLNEAFADWLAAGIGRDGENYDLEKSFKICKDKYNMSEDLYQIFRNTGKRFLNIIKCNGL
jgi:hypothetical protein